MKYELFEIYKRNFAENIRDENTVKEILTNKNNVIIENRKNDKLIGVSIINENTILMLCVDKEYRNRGIGSELLVKSETLIKAKGFNKINIGEGFDYLMPGVPLRNNNFDFFAKRGYIHSWGNVECFDMTMDLTNISYKEKVNDTINGINYRFAKITDHDEIVLSVNDAEPKFTRYYMNKNLYKADNNQRILIALKDLEVVGTLIISIETEAKDTGSVGCTTTMHKYRHQGIATNLVKIGTRHLKDLGLAKGFLGYTYSGLDKMYGISGYKISTNYMMAEKYFDRKRNQ